MTFSELPLVHDIKTGNRNSVDLMCEYDLTRSELTYLCEKFQHEGQISTEDFNRVLLGLNELRELTHSSALVHSNQDHKQTVDDEEGRRNNDNAGWGDSMLSVTDISSGLGRSTANSTSTGMMAVSASALDTAVGAEVAEAASNVVDVTAGVVEAVSGIAESGVDVADVIGGVAEVVGDVIGALLE
jgi:hypothetical protein